MQSCGISGDRVPLQLAGAEITLGGVVAAASFSSAGGEELEIESLLCLLFAKL